MAELELVRPMRPPIYCHVSIILAVCACAVVAADEPRLTPADVGRAADGAARQQGYDLKAYSRGESSYDPVSKTWGVNYRLKSSKSASGSEGVLSVDVNDATGFTSTRFWLASPTPAPPASAPSNIEPFFYMVYIAGGVLLAFAPFERKRTRSPWARATFLLTAFVLLFIGTSELLRHYRIWTLSPQIEHGFSHTLAVLRGVVLGFLVALAFSGELAGRKLASDEGPNQALQPTVDRLEDLQR